jgi:hypothetical protein
MARGDRKAELRARIGVEGLEGRNLQSALVGGAAASGTLIRPTAASASAYHTTVWGRSGGGLGALAGDDGFAKAKFNEFKVGLAEPAGTRIGTVATGDGSARIRVGLAEPAGTRIGTVATGDGSARIRVGLAKPAGTRIGTTGTGDGCARIMVRSATVQSEFATIKGESAPIEDGKGSPILM